MTNFIKKGVLKNNFSYTSRKGDKKAKNLISVKGRTKK